MPAGSAPPGAEPAARIAVVDDSDVVRHMVTRLLTVAGYEVVEFDDGESFVEWLESGRCDAVLLDSVMPGMSGLEVLQQVRTRFNREELPILFVTGNALSDHAVEALNAGANDFVVKPFDAAVLSARLGLQVALRISQEKLRASFAAQAAIQAELEQRAELALRELKLAGQLQESIYHLPDPPPFIAIGSLARPSSSVSGDILCSRITADGRFLLFVGDATGHGVTAALITMLVVALLRNLDGPEVSPRGILTHLNRQLSGYELEGKFVSAIAVTVDRDGQLLAANAGHPPGVVTGAARAEPTLLESGGPPLGWFADSDYPETALRLAPGDVVVLHTDGLTECQDRAGVEFGLPSVARIAQESRAAPPAAILDRLLDEASRHGLENLGADDVTAAVFRFLGKAAGG